MENNLSKLYKNSKLKRRAFPSFWPLRWKNWLSHRQRSGGLHGLPSPPARRPFPGRSWAEVAGALDERKGGQAASGGQTPCRQGFGRKRAESPGQGRRGASARDSAMRPGSCPASASCPLWASLLGRDLPAQDGHGFRQQRAGQDAVTPFFPLEHVRRPTA